MICEVIEEEGDDKSAKVHMIVCCQCGNVVHIHHFVGTPIHRAKVGHRFGVEISH